MNFEIRSHRFYGALTGHLVKRLLVTEHFNKAITIITSTVFMVMWA